MLWGLIGLVSIVSNKSSEIASILVLPGTSIRQIPEN